VKYFNKTVLIIKLYHYATYVKCIKLHQVKKEKIGLSNETIPIDLGAWEGKFSEGNSQAPRLMEIVSLERPIFSLPDATLYISPRLCNGKDFLIKLFLEYFNLLTFLKFAGFYWILVPSVLI